MAENENVSMAEKAAELAVTLGKQEKSEKLTLLCGAAVEELKSRMKRGVTPEDCGEAFPLSAAWLALSGLETAGDDVERFTAGAVSVWRRDGSFRQKALRLQALQVMRPWLEDEGFVFRGVKG